MWTCRLYVRDECHEKRLQVLADLSEAGAVIMKRLIVFGLTVGLLAGIGRAESIGTIPEGTSPNTALVNGRNLVYYGVASGRTTVPVMTAVGQTFSLSQAFNVTGMSFWLNGGLTVPPGFRAYIQNLSTGDLVYSSLADLSDQTANFVPNSFSQFSLNWSTPVAIQPGQQYVAFFSGVGLNISGLAQVAGVSATAMATGNAIVSTMSVSASEIFRNAGNYTTLNMDLAMSLRGTNGTVEVVPPPPPTSADRSGSHSTHWQP